MLGLPMGLVVILALVLMVIIVGGITLVSRYKTVKPNEALIITGNMLGSKDVTESANGSRRVKIVSGGGAFVLPIFQSHSTLSLMSHKIEVSTPEVYTEQGVPVEANAIAIIKVGSSTEDIFAAAERYMGKTEQALISESQEVLEGHLRSILGSMTVEEIYKNRDKFAQEVQGVAAKDLKKMGLTIDSFTIKDLKDKHGYLDALGKPRIAAVKRDAQIAEAEAKKEATVRGSQADEEAAKAKLLMETNVAEATKVKELQIATFKQEQDRAKAQADLAYEEQQAISQQEVIRARMQAQQIQIEKDIELAERESVRKEKELEATVNKPADAELYRRQQEALGDKYEQETKAQADAESLRISAEAKAQAEATTAKAKAEADLAKGQAEADVEKAKGEAAAAVERAKGLAITDAEKAKTEILRSEGEMKAAAEKAAIDNLKAKGDAEAAAIEAKGLAEARVAKEKAEIEVQREMGLAEAALKASEIKALELITEALPKIAAEIAAPMGNIDKVTIVDTGADGNGVGKMTGTVTNLMHVLPNIVKDMTGFDLGNALSRLTSGRIGEEGAHNPENLKDLMKVAGDLKPETLDMIMKYVKANKEISKDTPTAE